MSGPVLCVVGAGSAGLEALLSARAQLGPGAELRPIAPNRRGPAVGSARTRGGPSAVDPLPVVAVRASGGADARRLQRQGYLREHLDGAR